MSMAYEYLLNGPLGVRPLCDLVREFSKIPEIKGVYVRVYQLSVLSSSSWLTNLCPIAVYMTISKDEIYLAETGQIRVLRASDGAFKRVLTTQLTYPLKPTIFNEELFVCDNGLEQLKIFDV